MWLQRCGFEFLHQFHTTINPDFNFNNTFNQPDRNANLYWNQGFKNQYLISDFQFQFQFKFINWMHQLMWSVKHSDELWWEALHFTPHDRGKANPKMGLCPNAPQAWKTMSTISHFGFVTTNPNTGLHPTQPRMKGTVVLPQKGPHMGATWFPPGSHLASMHNPCEKNARKNASQTRENTRPDRHSKNPTLPFLLD